MKKLFIACFLLLSATVFAQTTAKPTPQSYKIENGVVVATTKATKQPDKVHSIVDGVTFYIGSKGGIYYFAINGKGEKVKRYVKK